MKGNHNSDCLKPQQIPIVFNISKIQNERKSQLLCVFSVFPQIVFNISKIQNERKSQLKAAIAGAGTNCVQHIKDTK